MVSKPSLSGQIPAVDSFICLEFIIWNLFQLQFRETTSEKCAAETQHPFFVSPYVLKKNGNNKWIPKGAVFERGYIYMFQTIMFKVSMSNFGRYASLHVLCHIHTIRKAIGRRRLRSGQWRGLSHAKVGKDKDEGFSWWSLLWLRYDLCFFFLWLKIER